MKTGELEQVVIFIAPEIRISALEAIRSHFIKNDIPYELTRTTQESLEYCIDKIKPNNEQL